MRMAEWTVGGVAEEMAEGIAEGMAERTVEAEGMAEGMEEWMAEGVRSFCLRCFPIVHEFRNPNIELMGSPARWWIAT